MTGDPADMPTCPACGAACGSTLTIQMLRLDAPDVQCSACGRERLASFGGGCLAFGECPRAPRVMGG